MSKYAEGTSVPPDRSRNEIEKIITKYGANSFATFSRPEGAAIAFEVNRRSIRMTVPFPPLQEFKKDHNGYARSDKQAQERQDQAVRQRWRALVLVIKAKLEAVESGVATFDQEFLPYILIPGGRGQTVGDQLLPQIAAGYESGKMPQLMLGMGDGSK